MITQGFSQDRRPDLKQLVHSLLFIRHGIPIYSKLSDGNQSDKIVNRILIPKMTGRMKALGREDLIYVGDSALIKRVALINDWDNGFLFVSRLLMTYREFRATINRAVQANQWEEIEVISEQPQTWNRKPPSYLAFERVVTLSGINYRRSWFISMRMIGDGARR